MKTLKKNYNEEERSVSSFFPCFGKKNSLKKKYFTGVEDLLFGRWNKVPDSHWRGGG